MRDEPSDLVKAEYVKTSHTAEAASLHVVVCVLLTRRRFTVSFIVYVYSEFPISEV